MRKGDKESNKYFIITRVILTIAQSVDLSLHLVEHDPLNASLSLKEIAHLLVVVNGVKKTTKN